LRAATTASAVTKWRKNRRDPPALKCSATFGAFFQIADFGAQASRPLTPTHHHKAARPSPPAAPGRRTPPPSHSRAARLLRKVVPLAWARPWRIGRRPCSSRSWGRAARHQHQGNFSTSSAIRAVLGADADGRKWSANEWRRVPQKARSTATNAWAGSRGL